tara:strand:+ start:725 stop:835 length:111 start_codon:yes stop_codon:yes gene_type:complete
MWFVGLVIGVLIGHYVIEDVKNFIIFHRARNEKNEK